MTNPVHQLADHRRYYRLGAVHMAIDAPGPVGIFKTLLSLYPTGWIHRRTSIALRRALGPPMT